MMNRKRQFVMAMVLGVLLGFNSLSYAIPTLSFWDGDLGHAPLLVADGDLIDSASVLGAVTYVGGYFDWTLNVTTGITKPFVGSTADAYMDLSSVNVTSSSGNKILHLLFSETDFTDVGYGYFGVGGTTTTGGTVQFYAWSDAGNALWGNSNPIAGLGPFVAVAYSGTGSGAIVGNPYSLTIGADIAHNGASISSFDAVLAVPEPVSMLLLGIGLFGIGIVSRKKK